MIDILVPAFAISLVLLGIHSYFGIRIIQRNIIFTDLAIGQMAAFGAAVSLFFYHGRYMYCTSLIFALITGTLISTISKRSAHLEAVIGLLYALGISGVFILLSKSPHGMEKFQNLMAYDILFTEMKDVYITAALYLAIGLLLFIFSRNTKGNIHDMLFFTAFAATVTSSVKIAGVLVVFAILLGPTFISIQISHLKRFSGFIGKNLLACAWIIGTVINMMSITISYYFDFPTGYTLVFFHALCAVCTAFFIKTGFGADNKKAG